ncbi:MAG: AAA family ATPase [Thermogemmatispora sp.]|uniref:DEAD/DEAH box helicase n=1 Tax=Thermogemmatispora sp. TaxID=1968838 RepID=UPI002627522F|nr:AAA domain-containing protein [Thermogemmatispora sp.]MBX5457365.1 AAA family ATPase [Thermogemmatispora sp.]
MQESSFKLRVLVLVVGKLALLLPELRQRYPAWPANVGRLQEELQRSYTRIPVLVRPDRERGQPYLLLCTSTYALKVVPSSQGDAYIALCLQSLGHREHDALARGEALMLEVEKWEFFERFEEIPRQWQSWLSNGYRQIIEASHRHQERLRAQQAVQAAALVAQEEQEAITPAQESLLATLERTIDLTRKIEKANEESKRPIFYSKVEAAGEARYSSRDIYIFSLVDPSQAAQLERGLFLALEERRELRGHVLDVQDDRFIVQFERALDLDDLRPPQAFLPLGSEAAFRVQQEAIERLRNGEATNSSLLAVLAEDRYQPYSEPQPQPHPRLNTAQATAFRRALAVKDLLLVQGPPGTGKTHTISEIVRACTRRGERVLVTARTHKAVDNVLRSLPRELNILRVGQELLVSPEVKSLLIDERARSLQTSLLKATAALRQALEELAAHQDEIDRFVAQSPQLRQRLTELNASCSAAWIDYSQTRQRLQAQINQERETAQQRYAASRQLLEKIRRRGERLSRRAVSARSRQHWRLLGAFWRWRLPRLQRRLAELQQAFQATSEQLQQLASDLASLDRRASQLEQEQPLNSLRRRYEQAATVFQHEQGAVSRQLQRFLMELRALLPAQELPAPASDYASLLQSLQDFAQRWSTRLRSLLARRLQLLRDWQHTLEVRHQDLYPFLLRMANVIGATCIGSATARVLSDVTFDLVLVDEAGQISLADLLVPLVRGKRAVLVGDHQQLPPIIDQTVRQRLAALSQQGTINSAEDAVEEDLAAIETMLSKSMFEMLVEGVDEQHFVMLTEQYRMSERIARFVSTQFYGGRLQTANLPRLQRARCESDPLFAAPFTFIDTAEMKAPYRLERGHYYNEAEAQIIAELALRAQQQGREWRIIVPYQEQAACIRHWLEKTAAEHGLELQSLIATVDSFQGGESDLVFYSFTRSNPRHAVGFLQEQRRLNVALTRAREQLILVGDSRTLLNAVSGGQPAEDFRRLMHAVLDYARSQGEYLSFRDCRGRLARAGLA